MQPLLRTASHDDKKPRSAIGRRLGESTSHVIAQKIARHVAAADRIAGYLEEEDHDRPPKIKRQKAAREARSTAEPARPDSSSSSCASSSDETQINAGTGRSTFDRVGALRHNPARCARVAPRASSRGAYAGAATGMLCSWSATNRAESPPQDITRAQERPARLR